MTKKQVTAKLNKIIETHEKQMIEEANAILKEADMWYGAADLDVKRARNKRYDNDRHGDFFINDGPFDKRTDWTNNSWLWTRKEVDEAEF